MGKNEMRTNLGMPPAVGDCHIGIGYLALSFRWFSSQSGTGRFRDEQHNQLCLNIFILKQKT